MMSDRNKIKALLDGRLSETEAQRLLEQLDSGDLERLMGAEELETRMVAYRERNPVAPGKTPELPPRDVDRMWAEISATPPEAVPSHPRIRQLLGDSVDWLRETLTAAPLRTYAATMALMLLLFMVPLQMVRSPQAPPPHSGVKGPADEAPATLQFAVVGANGVLERPERQLRETDTLAFRISAERSGYYSLYMVHAAGTDPIIIDRLLSPGHHDLQEAYDLGGNRGLSQLVLVHSEQAAPAGKAPHLALIRQAAMNQVSALILSGRSLTLHPLVIEVSQ